MATNVSIVGCYQTIYSARNENLSLPELVFTCARGLLDKYGLERADLGNVVIAADDLADGRSISSMVTAAPAGGFLKEFTKIAGDGAAAFSCAYLSLEAGISDLCMVIGWSKLSEVPYDNITNLTFDPFYLRPFLDEVTSKAIQAQRYVAKYNIKDTQAALVSVKNRLNACKNPVAHLRKEISVEEVLSSELLCSPIKELMNCVLSDGACALLLASGKRAESFRYPVSISGIGWNCDSYYMGDRELSDLASLRNAAMKAYKIAGIEHPLDEIDVVEISDTSAFHELMIYEALGFCNRGEGGQFIEQGFSNLDGIIPVNPSGGLISSNPGTAAGLTRIAECYLQVSGDAGARQVDDVTVALAHGMQGNASQANWVIILGK